MATFSHDSCHNAAHKSLDLYLDFNAEGRIVFGITGMEFEFSKAKTDAEILEDVVLIWKQIEICMEEIFTTELSKFVKRNKDNFN